MHCSATGWLLVPLLMLVGCGGSSDAPKTVPVMGKITYNGGAWPKPAKAAFVMQTPAEGSPMQSGTADIAADGTFKASTFDLNDGLVPGTFQVTIESWESEPAESPTPPKSLVPDKYRQSNQSGLTLEVPKDAKKPVEFNFDVPGA